MTTTFRMQLPSPHERQMEVLGSQARFNALACGQRSRRWGKTTLGLNLVAEVMLAGYPAGWFAGTTKLQADAWREIKRVLAPVIRDKSEVEHRIEIITGGVLEMWSLESNGAGRGRKYRRLIVDEAASARNLESDWNENIRPTLTDLRGDAWFAGTPKGLDYFWTLWERGQDSGHPDWASWQMPTTSNPYIAADEVESARLDMPERAFMQEYLAEFLSDGGAVFRRVQEAATATALDRGESGRRYAMGVDWGKHNDFTVIVVFDLDSRAQVALERFNEIDYTLQRQRLIALNERFRPVTIVAERNSMGEPLIEQLQRDGLPVQGFLTTNATKQQAVDALALAFERDQITILDDATLVRELLAFTMERTPSGLLRYTAPSGMHDDCVIALALGWQAVATGTVWYTDSPWG